MEEQQPQQEQQQKDQQGQGKQTAEAQMATQEQTTPMAPPRQDSRVDSSVLQTPQREDVNRKRERETPLTASPEKRQRLNTFSEEEMPMGQTSGTGLPSMEASASSLQQEQDRAAVGEVSSSGQRRGGEKSI